MKNSNYYHVKLYYTVIDVQFLELNSHFNEVNFEILFFVACFRLDYSFNNEKLIQHALFYSNDLSTVQLITLGTNLKYTSLTCILVKNFATLKIIG
jgi:hypothetical protein